MDASYKIMAMHPCNGSLPAPQQSAQHQQQRMHSGTWQAAHWWQSIGLTC